MELGSVANSAINRQVLITAPDKKSRASQVNWWNWDSKKETGHVGLKNQVHARSRVPCAPTFTLTSALEAFPERPHSH